MESKKNDPMYVAWQSTLSQIAVNTFMEVALIVKETKLVVSRPGGSGIVGSWAASTFFSSDTGPLDLLFSFQPERKLTPVPSLCRAFGKVRRLWGDLHFATQPFFCGWHFVTFQSCTDLENDCYA